MMRNTALPVVILFVVLLSGCGPTVAERLPGQWKGKLELDEAALAKRLAEDPSPFTAMLGAFMQKAAQNSAEFVVDLKSDGSMTTELALGTEKLASTGTWELKSSGEGQAVLLLKEKTGDREMVLHLDEAFLAGTGGFTVDAWGLFEGLGVVRFERL